VTWAAYLLQICDYTKWITRDFSNEVQIIEDDEASLLDVDSTGFSAREIYEPAITTILGDAHVGSHLAPLPLRPDFQSLSIFESTRSKRDDFCDLSVPELSLLGIVWNVDPTLRDCARRTFLHQYSRAVRPQTGFHRRERLI
jgi:hypothetical protein